MLHGLPRARLDWAPPVPRKCKSKSGKACDRSLGDGDGGGAAAARVESRRLASRSICLLVLAMLLGLQQVEGP